MRRGLPRRGSREWSDRLLLEHNTSETDWRRCPPIHVIVVTVGLKGCLLSIAINLLALHVVIEHCDLVDQRIIATEFWIAPQTLADYVGVPALVDA